MVLSHTYVKWDHELCFHICNPLRVCFQETLIWMYPDSPGISIVLNMITEFLSHTLWRQPLYCSLA
jgi:hypothetical protein